MSEFSVKSWRGTYFHLPGVIACVTFNNPNRVLANLVLTYFIQFSAFSNLSNAPILIKDSVLPVNGVPINGVLNTSPIAPLPFAPAINTLYFRD